MRYAQGGGLTPRARAARETLRLEAAELLAEGMSITQIAAKLRVSTRSARRWKAALRDGGQQALYSPGPGGAACRLDDGQLAKLADVLDADPAASGWDEDQRWTLARVATVIRERFGVSYTPRGVSYLLHRVGWTPQVPQHVATERDQEKVATWVREDWPRIKGLPRT